ncbi:MAG: mechanosensitive ion channel family protein [Chroococcidiopsidaceae cyanobacterium CP_BM_ER_R8_30]|nr:mechanosensitive ion channel family protein [Chroococcidiopsidaceae cyanobacterium CP_BM_ER_R8_30]
MRSQLWAITGSVVLAVLGTSRLAQAQLPFLPNISSPNHATQPATQPSNKSDKNKIVSGWVQLDGRRLFQIAAPKDQLPKRLQDIQQNLDRISQDYFQQSSPALNIQIQSVQRQNKELPVIYANNEYLMTVTDQDANQQHIAPQAWAKQLKPVLQEALERGRHERQTQFLIHQGQVTAGIVLAMIATSAGVYLLLQRRLRRLTPQPITPSAASSTHQIAHQLNQQQQRNLKEVLQRLFQLTQTVIWGSGTLIILGLFPYTRPVQVWILTFLQIPLRVGVVILGSYMVTRLSYALIDRSTTVLATGIFLTPETSQRLQLRISTISVIAKSLITLIWIVIGFVLLLIALGVDTTPLLASVGLIGVALSLASQNLIKDAINGCLIILEDQYAIGDVIAVGDKGGLVEKLNLRITQLRDSEGRLITIPNSEIKAVANLSSSWSRADLNIPIAYNTDLDEALKLIKTVAIEMSSEPQWQNQILETPEILGVDDFGDRGVVLRVWIKTQPLKQWNVAREYRRRLKIAFDAAEMPLSLPHYSIWVNDVHSPQSQFDGRGSTSR